MRADDAVTIFADVVRNAQIIVDGEVIEVQDVRITTERPVGFRQWCEQHPPYAGGGVPEIATEPQGEEKPVKGRLVRRRPLVP